MQQPGPEHQRGASTLQQEFKPVVKRQSGFKYMPERPSADNFIKQKWGWRATEPGGNPAPCSSAAPQAPPLPRCQAGIPCLPCHAHACNSHSFPRPLVLLPPMAPLAAYNQMCRVRC